MDEALTHLSTGQARNHERLEFLGDAVLRLAATEFIDRHHPDLSVGECSALRAQLVSDRWLAKLGLQLDLDPLIQLGDKARRDLAAKDTLRADTTEALIGALSACCGDLVMVDLWLTSSCASSRKRSNLNTRSTRPNLNTHRISPLLI